MKLFRNLIIIFALAFIAQAHASLVGFWSTNSSTGMLDTNTFRYVPLSNVQNADGSWNTIGFPIVVQNPTGIITNWLVQNNYLITNSVTGFWEIIRVPDSSSNYVTAGSISLGQNSNPFITVTYSNTITINGTNNPQGTLTNNTTGSAGWATTPASIASPGNLILYMNPDAFPNYISGLSNNFALPYLPDSSGSGNSLSNGLSAPLFLPQGMVGRAAISMLANWNTNGFGVPTISYGETNGMLGSWVNTNFSLTITYQDPVESIFNSGQNPFLWQAGNGATFGPQMFATEFYSNLTLNCGSVSVTVNGNAGYAFNEGGVLPLHHQPLVVTYNLLNGIFSVTVNGVTTCPTNIFAGKTLGDISDSLFILGNYYSPIFGGFHPATGAFCGLYGDVIFYSIGLSQNQIGAIQATEMQKYGIATGFKMAITGDSIPYGILSGTYSNLSYLVSSEIPGSTVYCPSYPSQNSTTLYGLMQQWIGQIPREPIFAMCPINDIIQAGSLTVWETNIVKMAVLAKQYGDPYYQCTAPSFSGETGGSFTRAQMTTFITNNASLFNGVIRLDLDQFIGANGSYTANPTYYATGQVHPSGIGYQEINSVWFYPLLQWLLYGITTNYTGTFTGNALSLTNYSALNLTTNGANPAPAQGQVLAVQAGGGLAFTNPASGGSGITALTSDVTASGSGSVAATVVSVGGATASNVASGATAANAAASINTASTIVKRDGSGNFTATTITAALIGNSSTATTATSFSGSLAGNVTGTQGATVVSVAPASAITGTLLAAQFPALTGDITTTAGALATTLKATGTAGTYIKTTFDSNGRETSGTTLGLADLPAGVLTNNAVGTINLATNGTLTVSNLTANGSVITFPKLPSTSAVGMVGVTAAGVLVSNAIPSGGGGTDPYLTNNANGSANNISNLNSGIVYLNNITVSPNVLTLGNDNEAYGLNAENLGNSSTLFCTAVGNGALRIAANDQQDDAFGYEALYASGSAAGLQAMSAFGYKALFSVSVGTSTTAFGYNSLTLGTTISDCVAMGTHSGESADQLTDDVMVGYHSGNGTMGNSYSTAVGSHSMYMSDYANYDTLIGSYAGAMPSGLTNFNNGVTYSVNVGYQSGMNCSNAGSSIFIGQSSGTNRANTLWIDSGASGPDSSYVPLILGYFDLRYLQIGGTLFVSNNLTSGGIISGNGLGVTNIAGTNIAFTVIETNFISGKLYVNSYGAPIELENVNVDSTAATGVDGFSQMQEWCIGTGTNYSPMIVTAVTGSLGGIFTNTLPSNLIIPNGATYGLTNISSGAGNSSTITGGQILIY